MAKPAKTERQKVIDDIRRKQKGADRRRGFLIVGLCAAVAVVIVGAAAYRPVVNWWELRGYADQQLSDIGAAPSVCQKVTTKPAEGSQDHVDEDVQVDYPDAPPAFGQHWNTADAPATMDRKVWTDDDRPELEALVHNLEHGYTILWYDETIADDSSEIAAIKAIAASLDANDTNQRLKFKAVPWTKDDGKSFPKGQHIAFTHWRLDAGEQKQYGAWQYCTETSGEALEAFMDKYPFTDSPEPYVP